MGKWPMQPWLKMTGTSQDIDGELVGADHLDLD